MRNVKGFTLIELMIVVAMILIVAAIFLPIILGVANNDGAIANNSKNTVSLGWNGMTEARCIDGYKFIVGEGGQARQIMDEFGHGVRCE